MVDTNENEFDAEIKPFIIEPDPKEIGQLHELLNSITFNELNNDQMKAWRISQEKAYINCSIEEREKLLESILAHQEASKKTSALKNDVPKDENGMGLN